MLAIPVALSGVSSVISMVYGVVATVEEFFTRHIEDMKGSSDQAIATIGRVLEGSKKGFKIGYVASTAVVVVGQLMLGHPVLAGVALVKSALLINPIAISCAAVGAIYYGWTALSKDERIAIVERTAELLGVGVAIISAVTDHLLGQMKTAATPALLGKIKSFVAKQAEEFGRSLAEITGSATDRVAGLFRRTQVSNVENSGNGPLHEALSSMEAAELRQLLKYPFAVEPSIDQDAESCRTKVVAEICQAGSHSLPFVTTQSYGQILAAVARNLQLPVPLQANVQEMERAILFKVLQRSIESMKPEAVNVMVNSVQQELDAKGVRGKVTLDQITRYVKFAGLDVGGSVGTLLMTAPGLAGIAGYNILQLAILNGVIYTGGYFAAGSAILGFGVGGALMTAASAVGPLAVGLGLLYTGYRLSGPAYRKLIPAICAIAAKRLQLAAEGVSRVDGSIPSQPPQFA